MTTVDLMRKGVPPRSRAEHALSQKNKIRVWFLANCRPLPDCVISGKRLWEYYCLCNGNTPTIRAFYQVARELLLQEPFVSSNSRLVKTPEGLVFINMTLQDVDHLIENDPMNESVGRG